MILEPPNARGVVELENKFATMSCPQNVLIIEKLTLNIISQAKFTKKKKYLQLLGKAENHVPQLIETHGLNGRV